MGETTVKIAVCIKRTPDSESRFRIAAAGAAIDETGLKFDMDDFAGYAVEAALQINEKAGGGETVVYALGPDTVQESLRKAMSMGVDRAVHLKTDTVPVDGIAVAKALAAELKSGAVKEIRGMGLMLGIDLSKPCAALVGQCAENGLLISVTADSVVRLVPPLIINAKEIDELVGILAPLVQQHLAKTE